MTLNWLSWEYVFLSLQKIFQYPCRKLNDSLSSSYESDDWKNRATQAEEQLRILEAEKERYKDDLLVMSARKQDLAKLGQVTEENKKLNKQVQYYKWVLTTYQYCSPGDLLTTNMIFTLYKLSYTADHCHLSELCNVTLASSLQLH